MAINLANNNSLANITALPSSISGGAMTLISEQTASASATISFTSGIDSTYDSYVFKFINMHPATDDVKFQVNFRDGDTAYDAVKTTTFFEAYHSESNDADAALQYVSAADLAQSTSPQIFGFSLGNADDECLSGELTLYNPSSTTFVKHFISTVNFTYYTGFCMSEHIAGYCNVTAAIDGVQFTMSTGNIDSGVIKLYGIS
jgi:hypothetical protein